MSLNFELLNQSLRKKVIVGRMVPPNVADSLKFSEALHHAQRDEQLFERTHPPVVAPIPTRAPKFSSPEIRELVQRIFVVAGAVAPRTIMFCAVEQHSPRNWISPRVAELLATRTQGSVCILDTNLVSPSLHTYFEVENRRGWAEAILEASPLKNFAKSVGPDHLQLISAGVAPVGEEPNAVLAWDHLQAQMSELRTSFDYVLVDAPPAANDSVTAHLASLVDGIILIVRPSFTPRQAARKAKEYLEAAGGRVLGVVLHRLGLSFPNRTESL